MAGGSGTFKDFKKRCKDLINRYIQKLAHLKKVVFQMSQHVIVQ